MKKFDFTVIKGDTWAGAPAQIKINKVPDNLTNVSISAVFKQKNKPPFTMSTTNTKIQITDAVNGRFKFCEQVIDVQEGNYEYELKFTYPGNVVKTRMYGMARIKTYIS